MKHSLLIISGAISFGLAGPAMADMTFQHLVTCLLKDVCTSYTPVQGELIDNGAKPWFYPVQGTDYGPVLLNKPITFQYIASNIGTGDLRVYGFKTEKSSTPFSLTFSDCPLTGSFVLKPGAACTVNFKFSPASVKEYEDTLVMLHSSTLVPKVDLDVKGSGIAFTPEQIEQQKESLNQGKTGTVPAGTVPKSEVTAEEIKKGLRLSVDELDFKDMPQGSVVSPQSIQVFNDTDKPLHPYSIESTLPKTVKLTHTCFPVIPAKGSCTLTATIDTSEVTVPSLSSSLSIVTSERVDAQARVIGRVTGYKVVATPDPLKVLSTSETVEGISALTLVNQGNADANINNVQILNNSVGGVMAGATFEQKARVVKNGCQGSLAGGMSCQVQIGYRSAVEGSDLGRLSYEVNGKSQTVNINAKMTLPDLTVLENGYDFGQVSIGGTSSKSITVKNIGDKAVAISGIASGSDYLSISNNQCITTLAKGDTCTATVQFKGHVLNQSKREHTISVINDGDLPSTQASFTGESVGGFLNVSTKQLEFGKVDFNSVLKPQTFTLSNAGNRSLNNLVITSDTALFKLNATGGESCLSVSSLAPGKSCVVSVAMDTSMTTGQEPLSGNIVISSDATNTTTPLAVKVSGGVIGGVLTVSPSSANFGTVKYGSLQEKTLTITNEGVKPAKILYTQGLSAAAMSIKTNTCTNDLVIPPKGTCQITFKMDTSLAARDGAYYNAKLHTDTASGAVGLSAGGSVSGPWIATTSPYLIPDTKVGTTKQYVVSYVNYGYDPLSITSAKFTNTKNGTWRVVSGTCSAMYAFSCHLVIEVSPQEYGEMQGTLTVSSNDDRVPEYSIEVVGSAYSGGGNIYLDGRITSNYNAGEVPFGSTKTVSGRIVNHGEQSIKVSSLTLPYWTVSGCVGSTLAPNGSCNFNISTKMAATSVVGPQVNTLAAAFTNADPQTVNVSVTPQGAIAKLSKQSIDFGNQVYHVERELTTTLTNQGVSPLVFDGAWSVDSKNEMKITDNCGVSLGAGKSCTITITYSPETEGFKNVVFSRKTNSYDNVNGVLQVSALGTGFIAKPSIVAPVTGLTGSTKTVSLAVLNRGNGGMVIQNIAITNAAKYAATLADPNKCVAIPSQGMCEFKLTYTMPADTSVPLKVKLEYTGGPSPSEMDVAIKDYSVLDSCSAIKAQNPAAISGIYTLSKTDGLKQIYCDQETDGGGWELAYVNSYPLSQTYPAYPIKKITNKALTKGHPIVSSTYSNGLPVIPNGTINDYNRVLVKGGTSAWQSVVGGWVSFDTFNNIDPVPTKYANARSERGISTIAAISIGWGMQTISGDAAVSFSPSYTANATCGGSGWSVGKNCIVFDVYGSINDTSNAHTEVRSYREVYYRY